MRLCSAVIQRVTNRNRPSAERVCLCVIKGRFLHKHKRYRFNLNRKQPSHNRNISVRSGLCRVDILINTIWPSRHEVYLAHICTRSLLRERRDTRQEISKGSRIKQKEGRRERREVKRGDDGRSDRVLQRI